FLNPRMHQELLKKSLIRLKRSGDPNFVENSARDGDRAFAVFRFDPKIGSGPGIGGAKLFARTHREIQAGLRAGKFPLRFFGGVDDFSWLRKLKNGVFSLNSKRHAGFPAQGSVRSLAASSRLRGKLPRDC